MMKNLLCLSVFVLASAFAQHPPYPFNDPNLPAERRIDNLLSLMTADEKVNCLGTRTGVQRLGVPNIGSSEGIHGVVQREARGPLQPITTTQFPQPPGMGETWDPDLVRQAAAVQGYEARFITQTPAVQPPDPHAMGTTIRPGARPPLGPQRRGVWRRRIFQWDHGRGIHQRPAGRRPEILAGRGAAQALPGQQQ